VSELTRVVCGPDAQFANERQSADKQIKKPKENFIRYPPNNYFKNGRSKTAV
jgi:hypothetical protein